MTGFDRAVAFVLDREGEPTNDPSDPGGETHFGISRRAHPDLTPWPPTREQAIAVYRRDYWQEIRGDRLPPAIALVLFDAAVNQGADRAVMALQRAARVNQDGIIGPVTLAAVAAKPDEVLERFMAERCWLYAETRNYARYGRGWFARAAGALIAAIKGDT